MAYFRLWDEKGGKPWRREFYYSRLSSQEQALYEQIMEAILQLKDAVMLPVGISTQRLSELYFCVIWDNPHICFVSSSDVTVMAGVQKKLRLNYLFPRETCRRIQRDFQSRVERIVEELDLEGLSDFEKELFLHDYMTEHLVYDFASAGKREGKAVFSHSAYGAVMYGRAVCQGISAMFKILADIAGIPTIMISGRLASGSKQAESGPHAWNLVCIDGSYAHLDVTNDLDKGIGRGLYLRFNFNDRQAGKSYFWEDRGYPKCETMRFYYYEYRKLTVHSEEEFEVFIRRRKEERVFQIRFGENFFLPEEDTSRYISRRIVQELVKYSGNAKIELKWIPEARLAHIRRF